MYVTGNQNSSTGCPTWLFSAFYFLGFHTHHRLRLPLSVHYCVLPIIYSSQKSLEPQHNVLHPLALLSLLRPRFILPLLHLLINTGIRGAAACVSPLRQIPPCNWDCFLFMLRYRSTALLYVRAAGSRDQSAAVRF